MINEILQTLLHTKNGTQAHLAEIIVTKYDTLKEISDEDFAIMAKVSLTDLQAFLKLFSADSIATFIKNYANEIKHFTSKKTLFTKHSSLAENIEELTEKKLSTIRYTTLHLGQDRLREVADTILRSNRIYVYAQGETRSLAHYLRTALKTLDYDVILTDENLTDSFPSEAKSLFLFLSLQGISFKENPLIMQKINEIRAKKWLITCNHDINFSGNRWVIPVQDDVYSEFALQHALDVLIALCKDLCEKGY